MVKALLKGAVNSAIETPVVGPALYDVLLKRALRQGRCDTLHTPEVIHQVYTEVIKDLSPGLSGPLHHFEAGVYAGESMAIWHAVATQLSVPTQSWGADSFQGLPDSVAGDEGGWLPGLFRCSRKVARWNLERLGAPVDRITLIEGWFDQSLTPKLAASIGTVHAAVIDADAYSSTVPVLHFLGPLLADPCYLIFDDWYSGDNYDPTTGRSRGIGVERAFNEWHAEHPEWQVEHLRDYDEIHDSQTTVVGCVLKLTKTALPI